MMEEVEDVVEVVAQEASIIVDILCGQKDKVLEQIYGLLDYNTQIQLKHLPSLRQKAVGIVEYFKTSNSDKCRKFLSNVWMFCENIPLDLEIKVLSVAGCLMETTSNHSIFPDTENSPRSRNAKRVCLDQMQSYTKAVKVFLQQKFERVTKDVSKEISLEETWVYLRHRNSARVREKSGSTQEREETLEHKESVESLLKTTGRVVVLLGQAGSGKTLLMHCLAQHWAQNSYPSIKLLFLLEFRQLNLVSQPLSLKDLLFRFFLPPEGGDEQSEALFNYILSNPEEICFIFDGYDEFGGKFTDPEKLPIPLSPYQELPMVDLLSGLCSYKILPKCTVLVTCRPRDVIDLFGSSAYFVAELLGFSQQQVKEYTEEYFQEKEGELKERAVSLLLSNRHLLFMSHVPALCHVCCVCLDHFLSKEKSQSPAELPTSLTQIYLHILSAFLNRCQGTENCENTTPLLLRYRSQIAELSKLAAYGLENSRIVFLAKELSTELMNFGANAGILSRMDLTCADGSRSLGCAFMHLTMQEFLTALHLMTSTGIPESELKRKLNLKSRWTTKTDPKTVFTDSLHLFMCGLAAEACTSTLALLEGSEDAVALVKTRQAAVLKILKGFVGTASQTGPKIVELCRCVHEAQDISLAKIVGSRARFELRNIRLYPVDMDALAFVTSAADQMVCLDFGGCSIELECLTIIPNCRTLEHVIFRSRKYDDKFAEALSTILPELHTLKQLEFISGGLTDTGTDKLVKALACCPQITHLDFSDNSLSDKSVRKIADLFPKLTGITSVRLGKNNITREGIFTLVEKMSAVHNIAKIHASGKKEINVLFTSNSHTASTSENDLNIAKVGSEISLTNFDVKLSHLDNLCSKLSGCSSLTVLNLSNNTLGNKGLKKLLNLLSRHETIQEINASNNGVDMDGLVHLSACLHSQKNLREVAASHNGEKKLNLKFSGSRDQGSELHLQKKFSLTESDVQPASMNRLCKNLAKCPHLVELDFSHGALQDDSVEKLLMFLPLMKSLQVLNISHVQMSTDGTLLFLRLLADCQHITAVELRPQGEAVVKFLQAKTQAATCKLMQYELNSDNVEKLSGILELCPHLANLDLSSNFLGDDGVKRFVDFLPRLRISNSVSLNNNRLSQLGALYVVNSLKICEKVVAVEVSLGAEEKALIRFGQENGTGKTLSLKECSFESDHWHRLLEILSSCKSQVKLQLSSSALDNQSQQFLLSKLAKLSSVQTLELRNNGLNAERIQNLLQQLCTGNDFRTIWIEEPWIKAEDAVCLVSSCLDLNPRTKDIRVEKTCFRVSLQGLPSSRAFHKNKEFSAVRSISFDDCEVEGQHLSSLKSYVQKCSSLLELHFSLLTMGTDGAEFLSSVLPSLENLKSLSFKSKGASIDEAVIYALQHTPKHLESLSLSNYVISDTGAAELGNALQSLTHIRSVNLSHSTGWTEAGGSNLVHGLVKCHSLEEIGLDSLQLNEESTVCLAQGLRSMTSLKKISLNKMALAPKDGSGVLCVLASLQALSRLEEIELEGLRMADRGMEELVKYIPKWTTLRKINLSQNLLSDQAGEMLVKALSHCKGLEQLLLLENSLGHGFAAKLGQILPTLAKLSELDLSVNQLGQKGCLSLCEGLVSLKALKKLRLTSIGTSDLTGVASCLKHCSSIEFVSLAWNKCGNDVALKLAEVLPQCTKLKKLDLEANNINTIGAKALAKCLESCPWIEIIRLWKNPIVKDDQILRDCRLNFSFFEAPF
ncbi:NLR family, CARD domain containing 5 [Astyanax mexicanus]|uniref:NLR family, CARD domain containing 5 n=1 Tax=Astyanax mexicanus TaxID=7994 RepID=UPI0020CAEEBD|nr:NLR family, CARD domain containing 5 [Astyanax mexicanus]XP_049339558.1 NLR family, CARD domain containing 5 [Astyanax mexicanus]